jgi:hypothetical protein
MSFDHIIDEVHDMRETWKTIRDPSPAELESRLHCLAAAVLKLAITVRDSQAALQGDRKMSSAEIRCNAKRNEMLAVLDSELENIKRIAGSGPQSDRDVRVTEMCMKFLAGYLVQRRAEAADTP